jgi:hypothetical protein
MNRTVFRPVPFREAGRFFEVEVFFPVIASYAIGSVIPSHCQCPAGTMED